MLQLTYDLGTYLNVYFSALSIADVKKGGFHLKKQSWPWKSHEVVPERSEHLNILETVKFDKKLPLNNLVMVKSRLSSHTSQRIL